MLKYIVTLTNGSKFATSFEPAEPVTTPWGAELAKTVVCHTIASGRVQDDAHTRFLNEAYIVTIGAL